jgi:DNA-directed RNA polymerase subunit beta
MPYLQNGKRVDLILNSLGIPSRMNVGQLYECLLGLAGIKLKENYKLLPFDELSIKNLSSILVYNKLYQAKIQTKQEWIFNPNYPGKMKIFCGKTGKTYNDKITIGYSYILKLVHLVKDKITTRFIGSYSYITKQPLKGKGKKGGQRIGEMEVWSLEGFGSSYILQEILTIKSDDLSNKYKVILSLSLGKELPKPNIPESFKIFTIELQSLCLDILFFEKNKQKLF